MLASTDTFVPSRPDWNVDWDGIDKSFPWIRKLRGETENRTLLAKGKFWTQDPGHHAEGWVSTHVRMVAEEMASSIEFKNSSLDEQRILFAASLLHDVCKPETWAVEQDGSITNRGHSRMGSVEARKILWQAGFPFALREQVCSLILGHQVPFWFLERPPSQARHIMISSSLTGRNDLLETLAMADARGRICPDQKDMIDNVALFAEAARDENCYNTPYSFCNDYSRVRYFQSPLTRDPATRLFDTTNPEFTVTLMSGMPGSGKSTWIREQTRSGGCVQGQPIVSMDMLRIEMNIKPHDDQGTVRQAALKRARELLASRISFVWDAVNIDRQRRLPLASLCFDYGARVRMIYVETTQSEMRDRNMARENRVPDSVIEKMLRHWEPPNLSECHELVLAVNGPLLIAPALVSTPG